MASFEDHLRQAKSNLEFLGKINSSCNSHWDWQVTVSFYVCVHFVNAHIAKTADMHYRTHKCVEEAINPYKPVSVSKVDEAAYAAYKSLRNLSRRSRYLVSENEKDTSTNGRFTCDKHFRKAIIHLDILVQYFKDKYGITVPVTALQCIDFRHVDEFKNFSKK